MQKNLFSWWIISIGLQKTATRTVACKNSLCIIMTESNLVFVFFNIKAVCASMYIFIVDRNGTAEDISSPENLALTAKSHSRVLAHQNWELQTLFLYAAGKRDWLNLISLLKALQCVSIEKYVTKVELADVDWLTSNNSRSALHCWIRSGP